MTTEFAGGLLVWRHWSDGTAFDEDTSIPVARSRSLPISATNGLGVGTALLAGAMFSFVTAL